MWDHIYWNKVAKYEMCFEEAVTIAEMSSFVTGK